MKAVLCTHFGMPEELELAEIPDPVPGQGQLLVEVHAAALNFPDVLMIQGKYQSQPPMPFSPGGEIAGVVAALGPGVTDWSVGDRVFGGTGSGGFAQKVAVPAGAMRRIPDGMDDATASGISTTYGTSYYALKQRAALMPGETLLVTGAGGGVGIAAVELGKAMGATVIAAASSDDKLALARAAGADHLVNYADGKLKDKIKALTGGRGVDVIYDPVGGALFDDCMRSIAWYGRVLVIGFADGQIPKLPTNLVLLKSCQVIGVFYGAWTQRDPQATAANMREILDFFTSGRLAPRIGARFAMHDYAAAMRCLMERRALGKVVLEIGA
ncbi:MAG: NADPH:quinone oxidoreductase family protein [Pseudomonadales bacterium]